MNLMCLRAGRTQQYTHLSDDTHACAHVTRVVQVDMYIASQKFKLTVNNMQKKAVFKRLFAGLQVHIRARCIYIHINIRTCSHIYKCVRIYIYDVHSFKANAHRPCLVPLLCHVQCINSVRSAQYKLLQRPYMFQHGNEIRNNPVPV